MSNPYNSATERASILGPTLYFKGDLTAEEDLLIQGRVEGSITHTQRLTVGPQGTVKANIKAQLIKNRSDLPNPAVYAVETDLSIPMEETLLPIAKRSLVRYITVNTA